ncbi:MAG TPA: glycosyltransferase [Candidatus Paceibacterota bacterium]|nr:glycosyltransferase [Candidatus Paceibacterota bacterium]
MRIVFFSDNFYPEVSGIADSIMILGKQLEKRGHEVRYVGPRYSEKDYQKSGRSLEEEKEDRSFRAFRLPSLPLPFSPTGQSRVVLPVGGERSLQFLDSFKPDIIHTQSFFGTGLEAIKIAKKLRIPLIGTNHTFIDEFFPSSLRRGVILRSMHSYVAWYYNHCRFVSTPAQGLLRDMQSQGLKAPAEVIVNPLSLEMFSPATESEKKSLKEKYHFDGPTVFYCGRLAPEKHVDTILRALPKVKEKIPDVQFVIAGHGSTEKELKSLTRSLSLQANVHFMGFVEPAQLSEFYKASDIFAIFGTAENQPLTLAQAYAAGLPAVGADARGLREYITEDTGFVMRYDDAETLASKIQFLLENEETRKKMGENAKEKIEKFEASKISEKWEDIYEEYGKCVETEKVRLPEIQTLDESKIPEAL